MPTAEQPRGLNRSETSPAPARPNHDPDALTRTNSQPVISLSNTTASPSSASNAKADTTIKRSQSTTATPSLSKPAPTPEEEYRNRLQSRVKKVLATNTGPSFEMRSAAGAARMQKKAKAMEVRQKDILEQAVLRARARPIESPSRPKHLEPESVENRVLRGHADMRQREQEYAKQKADLLHKMATREPLFKLTEVQAAFEEQQKRQAEYKQQMREDEARRWEMIRGLKEKVLDRPMLVDDYRKPCHATPDQITHDHSEETELDRKIQRGMTSKNFRESSWAQTVEEIHKRADNRVPLHKIPYPPKKFPEYKARPNIKSQMDATLEKLISEPAFQGSEWARSVKDIAQRQNDRPKLHEIEYPSKVGK